MNYKELKFMNSNKGLFVENYLPGEETVAHLRILSFFFTGTMMLY
jgi:hypothetical protein